MRRSVFMAHTAPADASARLTRHLTGRMLELMEDGARIIGSQDPFAPRDGVLHVDFTTMDNAEMALLLDRDYGVTAALDASGACVCFSPGSSVTFEDIDYVQGAVLEILARNR